MRDWTEIETVYIAGNMSLRELAKQQGVSYSSLSKIATKRKWAAKRQRERDKLASATLGRARARNQRKLEKLISATERAMDTALSALEDEQQFRRYIVSEGRGEGVSSTEEKIFDKIDTKALKELTGVLRDLTALARDFYGIRTPSQSVAEKIALEKLELERKRTEAKLPENEDRELRVTMSGDAEELGK